MKTLIVLSATSFVLCAFQASATSARTWHILPDGTGDAPTIEAGIDSATTGDTVLVACGTYFEHDITISTSAIIVRSESGDPDCVTINAEMQGRVMYCQNVDASTHIHGFTLTGGLSDRGGGVGFSSASPTVVNCRIVGNESTFVGGGFDCRSSSSPSIEHCEFIENTANWDGGGLYCLDASSPTLSYCSFIDNDSGHSGGGMRCEGPNTFPTLLYCTFLGNLSDFGGGLICFTNATPSLTNCTFSANIANSEGGGVYSGGQSVPELINCIVAFSVAGAGVFCEANAVALLEYCDLYDNAGGDWIDSIADQLGVGCNMAVDPLFCGADEGDLSLDTASLCLPDNNECGVQIGAHGVGCAVVAIPTESQRASLVGVACYPNPLNPQTTISFSLVRTEWAEIGVYDLGGRLVCVLANRTYDAGHHSVVWYGKDAMGRAVPSGSYFVRLETESTVETQKVSLIR